MEKFINAILFVVFRESDGELEKYMYEGGIHIGRIIGLKKPDIFIPYRYLM